MAETREQAQRAIQRVTQKYDWQLIEDAEHFAQQVEAEATARNVPLDRAAMRCYCRHLHDACGSRERKRQTRALREIHAYLFHVAQFKTRRADAAEDLAQRALVKVWERRAQCREPGSFLAFAKQILIFEILEDARHENSRVTRPEIPISDLGRDDDAENDPLYQVSGDTGDEGLLNAMRSELRQEIFDALEACLNDPRKIYVIVARLLNDAGYAEIAATLGVSINLVNVMYFRARQELQNCPALQKLFVEYRS